MKGRGSPPSPSQRHRAAPLASRRPIDAEESPVALKARGQAIDRSRRREIGREGRPSRQTGGSLQVILSSVGGVPLQGRVWVGDSYPGQSERRVVCIVE